MTIENNDRLLVNRGSTSHQIKYEKIKDDITTSVDQFPEAPNDGQQYGRKNSDWTPIVHTPAYTNADVDAHLNKNQANGGQILSWNGSDYRWVNDQTGDGNANTNFISYTYPSGNSRSLQDRLEDYHSVKDFGAVGNGTTDDTVAVKAALNSGGGVYFPKGEYRVRSTITVDNKALRIFGDGPGSVIKYDPITAESDCLRLNYNNAFSEDQSYSLADISIMCASGKKAGAGVRLEYTGVNGVIGAVNKLHINNVNIGSLFANPFGRFRRGLYMVNSCGVRFHNLCIFSNDRDQTINEDTVGIDIYNTRSNHGMIRALLGQNLYLQQYRTGIKTRRRSGTNGTIESVYITNGEILAFTGLDFSDDAMAAISVQGFHFDVIHKAINLECRAGPTRIVGNDLRGQRLDDPIVANELLYIKGSDVTISGNFMAADRHQNYVIFVEHEAKGVSITGNVIKGISNRTFYPIKVNDRAKDVTIGGNAITEFAANIREVVDDSGQAVVYGQRNSNTV